MIEIALCDDSAEDISALGALAEGFAAEHSEFSLRLSAFTSSSELLERIESSGGFDLYILDVVMPDVSGIQLAERIRSRGERAEIIFLTVSREYAVDAFSVHASGYLIKPVSKPDFDKELLRGIREIERGQSAAVTVKTKDGLRRITLRGLVMIESFNHVRVITMSDGSAVETPETLSELFEKVCGYKNFCMPHRAYIVNLDHAMGLTRYDLIMLGNRRIPIPRRQFTAVREMFSSCFFK
ncbi:MAG: LytTR family DNA-binding domain-containing protein [Lachnospiraceae bacterium]|nr:LytTR family DNA-binding domain-containing protein [Ruminococcus sp.]MCM1274084.1 LytTR family DNA-binding domain-containing protein [Lachnospiraceae bacterium]